ncbi:hypothetical protein [Kineosporia babensis]|uniref:Uncharacterized protein n=1 Tax=Kineosporia babensis TaxID=499548 RepID=A0A9X1T0S2_9ACTN|nr:hypothetical protein [Kineosporia babensis]MCD5313078.1 hypothetical protein [Kineosporia babensis]
MPHASFLRTHPDPRPLAVPTTPDATVPAEPALAVVVEPDFVVPVAPDELPVPVQEPRPDSSADYRATHSVLLTSLFGPGRPALPPEGSELCAYGPLLGARRPDTGRRVGGIVVPTGRSFRLTEEGLLFAADIALTHGCPLIVVHSRDALPEEFPQSVRDLLGDALVLVDLDSVSPSWQPGFATAEDELSSLHRCNDVGWKRNLGIMLAVRFGWEFVLFLDDDIRAAAQGPTLTPRYLAHALRVLNEDPDLMIVGWTLRDFDDNSVVGHARPLVGLPQDIFISSGALLLRVGEDTAFFPHGVYNEDWMLVLQTLAGARDYQRALAHAGPVHQKPYEAFCPERARSEETGEILAEGLMNLAEDHGPAFARVVSGQYWKRVMARRRTLLRTIVRGRAGDLLLWDEGKPPRSDDPVVVCMNTALWTHQQLHHRKLLAYTTKWRQDWDFWKSVLVRLSQEAAGPETETEIPRLLASVRARWPHPEAEQGCQDRVARSASTTDRGRKVTF